MSHFRSFSWTLFLLSILFFGSFKVVAAQNTAQPLVLTPSEEQWLAQHQNIKLAIDIAWPPFEWVDENQYKGISSDYIALVEKKLGIQFDVEKEKTWPEVIKAVKNKQLDVYSCVARNPEREEYVTFTKPYLSFPMVIITTDSIDYIDGINGLEGIKVGVVEGYATHEYITKHHPQIQLKLYKNTQAGLKDISQGKTTAFIDNIATATTLIKQEGLTNLKISGEMPIRYELAMAVRKDWPEFVTILQKALNSITNKQHQEIQNRWIRVRYEHGFDSTLFIQSLIFFVTILVLLFFYNRKLVKEIDQRKKAEEQAKLSRDAANKASKAKSEFLSVMSHELRTPLTSIKGALNLLQSDLVLNDKNKVKEMLNIANKNSERLLLLINDILDIEKLLAGQMSFHKQKINLTQLITTAIESNHGYAQPYQVNLKSEFINCEQIEIYVDENRILQVLSNFISNAIKYSPKNETVIIRAEHEGEIIRVSVIDRGQGVPESFREKIFGHFTQADSSDTREKGGTGLGLAISKEIIERHGGKIGYTSPPGKGATFFFEFKVTKG